ncbi:MAG: hypothetical protein HYZ26_11580 [Chloroflexi bacterium]|nr:hypothetical protein [Chloroflexota bacterium]
MMKIRVGLLSLLIALSACTPGTSDPQVGVVSPTGIAATTTVTMSATVTPSPPVMALIGSTGDPAADSQIENVLLEVAVQRGWRFHSEPDALTAEGVAPVDFLVAIGGTPGLAEFALQSAASQILIINGDSIAGENVLAVSPAIEDFERLGFVSGYFAAVISDEWRVGLIMASDAGFEGFQEAFVSGMRYFCGLCQSYFPPFVVYPRLIEIPPSATDDEASRAVNELISNQINTAFIGPGADTVGPLAQSAGLSVVGVPGSADLAMDWEDAGVRLTIPGDLGRLAAAINDWLDGQAPDFSGLQWNIYPFTNDSSVVSPGKVQVAKDIIPNLFSGLILP